MRRIVSPFEIITAIQQFLTELSLWKIIRGRFFRRFPASGHLLVCKWERDVAPSDDGATH